MNPFQHLLIIIEKRFVSNMKKDVVIGFIVINKHKSKQKNIFTYAFLWFVRRFFLSQGWRVRVVGGRGWGVQRVAKSYNSHFFLIRYIFLTRSFLKMGDAEKNIYGIWIEYTVSL